MGDTEFRLLKKKEVKHNVSSKVSNLTKNFGNKGSHRCKFGNRKGEIIG